MNMLRHFNKKASSKPENDTQKRGFEGWYFKHQLHDDMIAFIPGRAVSGDFVQVLTSSGSRQFAVPEVRANGGSIRAGECLFSKEGCSIELPGIHGEISYGTVSPLHGDIMGPFRYLPMECRHGVISMTHDLRGSVNVEGVVHRFDGGRGYIEKDSGTSFPRSYQWLQCNDFAQPCALMVSVAHIPFCGAHFTGCICAILYGGREYRLATYDGARVLAAGEEHLCLSQRKLLLEVEIVPERTGHPLRAPVGGQMSGTIRESVNACIRVRLWEDGKPVLDERSAHAAYEYVPAQRNEMSTDKKHTRFGEKSK
jgi:tocopherol cyclase